MATVNIEQAIQGLFVIAWSPKYREFQAFLAEVIFSVDTPEEPVYVTVPNSFAGLLQRLLP